MKPKDHHHISVALAAAVKSARDSHTRSTWLIQGDQRSCLDLARSVINDLKLHNCLWITDGEIDGAIPAAGARQILGQEYEVLVYDGHSGFDPDALGASVGTLAGGGLFLLLMPLPEALLQFRDPFCDSLASWPYKAQDLKSRFLQRLQLNFASTGLGVLRQKEDSFGLIKQPEPVVPLMPRQETSLAPCATADQQRAVAGIEALMKRHRYRPLLISADRGRGKSAALGIAAARLLQQGIESIVITAPSLHSAEPALIWAGKMLPQAQLRKGCLSYQQGHLEYMAPDLLCQGLGSGSRAQLLLVDEAAAIPLPMLQRLLEHHPRVVFSSTVHGYEGTGRGFALKFCPMLDRLAPGWVWETLSQPVRWAANDPLESWAFRLLLLDAELPQLVCKDVDQCDFVMLDRDQLAADENLLAQLFALLLMAHYQTRPRDLRYLLDAADLSVYVLKSGSHIVATALTEKEGDLDPSIAGGVYQNQRRVQGHLLAQTLEAHAGLKGASTESYLRVIRIAVHPQLQGRGLGSRLLQEISRQAQSEALMLGASFGATVALLRFWERNDFYPVHMGVKRNAASGANAVTLLHRQSKIFRQARNRFQQQFVFMLNEQYAALHSELVLKLLSSMDQLDNLSDEEWEEASSFGLSLRSYDALSPVLWKLSRWALCGQKAMLDKTDQSLLVCKVLQKNSWEEVVRDLGLSGRREAVQKLRQAVANVTRGAQEKQ